MRKAEVAALPPFVNLQQRIDEIMGMFLSAVATDLSPEELNIEKKHMEPWMMNSFENCSNV